MKTFRFVIAAVLCAGFCQAALAMTPWERWMASPSTSNAKQVRTIEYTSSDALESAAEATTRDLRILARRVRRGSSDAVRIAIRLSASTVAGANLEDLYAMLGVAAGDAPTKYLAALAWESGGASCPGIRFLGGAFVDDEAARAAELRRRKQALLGVSSAGLAAVRDLCLKELASDG